MAVNNWRKLDETSFSQQLRLMDNATKASTNLVNNIYNAHTQTSNTDPYSINAWEERNPWYSFTIKTPKGRLLEGVLVNNNDIGEKIVFTDVKFWGEPISISTRLLPEDLSRNPYSKILDNKPNARALAKQYTSWWNKKINLWINDKETIDDELDRRYEALKQDYLKMFKKYRQSRPDEQRSMAPQVAEALIKYNILNK